ncbi:MAG: transglycosylase SLT domain-containing protein [Burkholderiaceae bacterium]
MKFSKQHRPDRLIVSSLPLVLLCCALLAGCATPPTDNASGETPGSTTSAPAPLTAATQPSASASAASAAPAAAPTVAEAEIATAPVPIDPLRPEVRLDLDDRSAQTDLWGRVRRGFAMPDLDGDLVRNREQWYATRPDYVQRMTERGGRYLFHIVEELERRGMPTELALLPFIESAFNPQAMSTAKASGMWQFIPSTGKDFSLKQNVFRDDRRDVLASTRAALDYLQKLHGMFGDWHLALAAYNWGEGSVQRAINRNQKLGLPTDYASLKMPNETQYYVPKLQAVKNIVARPADFGLTLPVLSNHPYFLSVPIERDMDVAVAVRLAGMRLEDFQTLNPQMNKPVILAAGTPQVLLPYDNANQFVRELPLHRGPLASWTAWTVPKTLRPAEAARLVGMDEAELREVNRIPLRMLVRAGSTLLVPRGAHRLTDVSVEVADNASMSLAPDGPSLRKVSLRAGRKDSVASVAKRYRVSAAQVAQWNEVGTSASFRPGQSITVYVAGKAARGTKAAKAKGVTPKPTHTAAAPRKAAGRPARAGVGKSAQNVARY